jgi:hypothetical protein
MSGRRQLSRLVAAYFRRRIEAAPTLVGSITTASWRGPEPTPHDSPQEGPPRIVSPNRCSPGTTRKPVTCHGVGSESMPGRFSCQRSCSNRLRSEG